MQRLFSFFRVDTRTRSLSINFGPEARIDVGRKEAFDGLHLDLDLALEVHCTA